MEWRLLMTGRGVVPGIAEGNAIVFPDSIAGNSGALGDTDGVVYEVGNVNYGMSIKDAIIVLPCAKGSNGFSAHFKSAHIAGVAPAGCVASRIDARLGVAIASLNLVTVADFGATDPLAEIKTGDRIRLDGTTGEVFILNREG